MKKMILVLFVVVSAVVAGFYVMLSHLTKQAQQVPVAQEAVATKLAAEPPKADSPTHYPIASKDESNQASELEPLPSLQNSDGAMQGVLVTLLRKPSFIDYFNLDGFVRRVVATIDNLPRETVAVQLRPLKPVDGTFRVANDGESLVVAPSNMERYDQYIEMMQGIDARTLVALYSRFYPLFQQAYKDLGYPKGYFNDRLIAVIDHLLACPEAPAALRLVQPHVYFAFADPNLEHMSAGDKILFRIGKANADKVKHKLREIRAELIRKSNATL